MTPNLSMHHPLVHINQDIKRRWSKEKFAFLAFAIYVITVENSEAILLFLNKRQEVIIFSSFWNIINIFLGES